MTATRRSRSYEVSPRGRRAGFRSPRLTQTQPVSPEERLFSPDGPENRAPLVTRRVSGDHTGSLSPEEPTHVTSTPRASLYGARVPPRTPPSSLPLSAFFLVSLFDRTWFFARRIIARVINRASWLRSARIGGGDGCEVGMIRSRLWIRKRKKSQDSWGSMIGWMFFENPSWPIIRR